MDMKELGEQLRLPHGENAITVADLMAKSNKTLYEWAFTFLNLRKDLKILEAGPADGRFVNELFKIESDLQYTGIDLSHEMISSAKETNKKLVDENKAEFIYGDVCSLPFYDHTFDRIFTLNTLYFWNDPEKGLKELVRVLKSGGTLLMVIRSREAMEKMPFTESGFRLYSENELKELINANSEVSYSIQQLEETTVIPDGKTVNMVSFCAVIEKK